MTNWYNEKVRTSPKNKPCDMRGNQSKKKGKDRREGRKNKTSPELHLHNLMQYTFPILSNACIDICEFEYYLRKFGCWDLHRRCICAFHNRPGWGRDFDQLKKLSTDLGLHRL